MTPMDGSAAAEPVERSLPGPAPALDREQLTANVAWVRAVARNLVRDPWGAEDVTQETLLAALSAPPRDVPDEQRLRAWLGRVAFNLSRLGARQGARRRAREVRVARHESQPSVCDELQAAGTVRALTEAIAGLDEPYRSVVLMRYFDALSTAEIAARTGTSELAVRKRLWRARNKLRASLDHDPESGQLLAALLPWIPFTRGARLQSAGAVAAGVSVCLGVGLWLSADAGPRSTPPLAAAEAAGARHELLLGALAPSPPDEPAEPGPGFDPRRVPLPTRPSRTSGAEPEGQPPRAEPGQVERFAAVRVFDLEGFPRAGLEIVEARSPGVVLATSGASGELDLALGDEALVLEARADGWTTVVPARLAPGSEALPHTLVVARAADLAARVVDESGLSLPQAVIELRCDERAFAAIPAPVALASARLRTLTLDGRGYVTATDLARGPGLALVVHARGFEPLERETRTLAAFETFVLRALPQESVLAGTVRRRSGVPAAGARVQLGQASTTTDDYGRFHLPLRGVHSDSSLQVSDGDKVAEPTTLRHFGARIARDPTMELELELGPEHDPIDGKLVGDGAAGWLVAAFTRDDGTRDEFGRELPLAETYSDAQGAFRFALPRGTYDVYALDPTQPRLARSTSLESLAGAWTLAVPPAGTGAALRTTLRGPQGQVLAQAEVRAVLRLEPDGARRLVWRELTSDARGELELPRDLEGGAHGAALELEVGHAALGRLPATLPMTVAASEPLLAAPAFVQLAGAGCAHALRVLDADGRTLEAFGPLDTGRVAGSGSDSGAGFGRAAFGVSGGASPVLEVPANARWLELDSGLAFERVAVQPRAGALVEVRP